MKQEERDSKSTLGAAQAPAVAPPAADDDDLDHAPPKLCAVKRAVVRTFPEGIDANRRAMISVQTKLWAPGSTLTWALMPDGYRLPGSSQRSHKNPEWVAALKDAFNFWQNLRIPITFKEVSDPNQALIRVTFFPGESWSYVGRDISNIPVNQPTMNIGFMSPNTTALHEVGHTLGLEHEHQNPFTELVWNEQAVIDWARETQGWPEQEARQQILNPLNPNDPLRGTWWDPTSVMHYPFPPKCIAAPVPFTRTGIRQPKGLSSHDIDTIRRLYPDVAPQRLKEWTPFKLQNVATGSVHAFEIVPEKTQKYVIKKVGGAPDASDAILVLMDKDGQKIAADDDAGEPRDGKFEVKLEQGVKYILNIRIAHVQPAAKENLEVQLLPS